MSGLSCLLLTPFVPYPPTDGGRIRCLELARRLSERNRVTVLALTEPTQEARAAVAHLRREGIDVEGVPHSPVRVASGIAAMVREQSLYGTRFRSRRYSEALRHLLRRHRYDIVQCEFMYMAQYCPPGLRRETWILDEHNIEHAITASLAIVSRGVPGAVYRAYAKRETIRRRDEERVSCNRVDHVLTVSTADLRRLRAVVPGLRASVLPNGVDLDRFPRTADPAGGHGAVFVGKMDYAPNVDGAIWFSREVLPLVRQHLRSFTFTIVGKDPSRSVRALERIPGVRVTGTVADPRPFLEQAAVVVTPLRAGSGTRLKVIEALATARPVVTTTLGCEGLDLTPGHHALVADTAIEFAESIMRLARRPDLRTQLADAGRSLVEPQYDWRSIISALEDLYRTLTRGREHDRPRLRPGLP